MKSILLLLVLVATTAFGQGDINGPFIKSDIVSFDDFLELAQEVKPYREKHLVSLAKFKEMALRDDVIILDTRSDSAYAAKHIKGAVHLDFSDFTQSRLAQIIPDKNTTVLIYCNNNFKEDELNFPSKAYRPEEALMREQNEKERTLALNIPTFINLYGYGYREIYELGERVPAWGNAIEFEGTAVTGN